MSYRRGKESVLDARAWRRFVETNTALLEASGVPAHIYKSREMFVDLLMHGYIDHHPDPSRFGVEDLLPAQREALIDVIVRYLHAGFPNPGIQMLGGPTRAEILRRADRSG